MTGMRNTLHANLGDGGYRYEYEDGLGNRCTAVRAPRGRSERTFWTHDLLPKQEFTYYADLKTCLDATMPDALIWEADQYPRLEPFKPDTCGNVCRLCPRIPGGSPIGFKHETWSAHIHLNWQNQWHASLCVVHRDKFAGNPRELLAALKVEVEERKARTAAFRDQLRAAATLSPDRPAEVTKP